MPHRMGRKIKDRFVVERYLGGGAFGEVYRVRDAFLDETCALKIFRQGKDDVLKDVRNEFRARRNIMNRHVARVYGVDRIKGGAIYIHMEYIDGRSLAALLRDQGPVSPSLAASCVREILNGVGCIHNAGIIHRDIKPDNIIIQKDDTPTIVDFNIASHIDTVGSTMIGTPAYMAPEILSHTEKWSNSCDLFAVGVILYEMLTNESPYLVQSESGSAQMFRRERPPSPSSINPAIPNTLSDIVMKAISDDPQSRYQSAEEMSAALESVLELMRRQPRILRFPTACSVGELLTREMTFYPEPTFSTWDSWQIFGEALGDISVSSNSAIALVVDAEVKDFSFLGHLEPNALHTLDLTGTKIQDDDLIHIDSLSGLHAVYLTETSVGNQGFALLRHLPSLQILALGQTSVTNEGLAHLRTFRSLRHLLLCPGNIDDDGLIHLKHLTSLRGLDLISERINGEGLVHLRDLIDLEWLDLSWTRTQDEDLKHLEKMTSLESLILFDAENISDEGFAYLMRITSLRFLDLRGTAVTREEVTHLEQSLPNLKVTI